MKRTLIIITLSLLCGFIFLTSCQQPEVTAAKVYLNQSNWDRAIEQCNLAIEKMPNNPDAYFILGQAYAKKGNYHEMNDAFKKSLEFSPKYAAEIEQNRIKYWVDLFNSGVGLIKQDKLQDAAEKFSLAVEILPERIDGYKNLAFAYTQMDNDSLAIQTYSKAIEVDPNDMELKNFLGILYYQNKKYEEAIEVLKEVLAKSDPGSKEYSEALYNLAYSYDLMGQSDKAIEAYQNALEKNPNDKDLLFNMGRIYFMQDNYEKAIESFKKVLEFDPNDFDANLNIGNAYYGMGDSLSNEAQKTDDSGNPVLSESEIQEKVNLAKTNFDEAIPYLEKAAEIKPDNENAWTMLGIVYVRSGYPEKGKEAFDKAEQLKNNE